MEQTKPRLGTLTKGQINAIAKNLSIQQQVPEEENQIRFHLFVIDYHVKNGGSKNDEVLNDNWKALENLGITPDYLFKKSAAKKAIKLERKQLKNEKIKAKINVKNARATNIESKADSRKALADQGINMGSEAGGILNKVADTVQAVATGKTPDYNQNSEPVVSSAQQSGGGNVEFPSQDTSAGEDTSASQNSNTAPEKTGSKKIFVIVGIGVVLLIAAMLILKRKK